MNYKCPCCGYYTFSQKANGTYDICSVCFWEDDLAQLNDPDFSGGANKESLNQSRLNFIEFGACDIRAKPYVRPPNEDELQGLDY